jgi:polyhydroxybutyrate depolymerase
VPLVVALQPSGGSPSEFEARSRLDAVAARNGFVVAYLASPPPVGRAWLLTDMPSNLAYISSQIASLTATENIDPRRVYVTGFSAGATMAFFAGCQLSHQVDGIAVVSGAMRFSDPCKLAHPVSEMLVIGTNDAIPIGGSARLLSASQVSSLWRSLDGCAASSSSSASGTVSAQSFSHCRDGSGVSLYVIQGGTHQWPRGGSAGPDGSFDAAQAVWAFFAAHPGSSSTRIPASLRSVQISQRGRTRSVTAALALDGGASAAAGLSRGGRTAASTHAHLAGRTTSLSLAVPAGASAGAYVLTIRLTDPYGRHLTLTRSLALPAA